MPSTPVEIQLPSGLSPTLSLYAAGSDVLANTGGADTLTENTNAKGLYSATVTEALVGIHYAQVMVGSDLLASGWVDLNDDTTTYRVIDDYLWAAATGGTSITPTPSPAGFSTGYIYAYDEDGVVETGVNITVTLVAAPRGAGLALDTTPRTIATNGSGYAEFTNLIQGASYDVSRGDGDPKEFVVPADSSFELANVWGADA